MEKLNLLLESVGRLLERAEACLPQPRPVVNWEVQAFRWSNGGLRAVEHPHEISLDDLAAVDAQKARLFENTRQFVAGRTANNVLLTGARGTGKSSLIKAVWQAFRHDGLRLIEVKKNQLYQIPALMDELAKNPLKFILFIDDLSFASNDDNFAALKAILEGSVGGRARNIAVYATSTPPPAHP
jgi:predicted AAA+ superfamily ATPase